MDKLKIIGEPLPDMPWEDRPADCKDVIWRYSNNPVIPRDIIPTSNSVFNSAVVPFKGGYAGVFRCDDTVCVCMSVSVRMLSTGIFLRQSWSSNATTKR